MTEKFELMSEDFLINMLETQKAEKAKVNELEIVITRDEFLNWKLTYLLIQL